MKISQKTQDTILELNEFSSSKLKNIPDLTIIIEIAENSVNKKLYNDLQFSAKYVNGLAKILQSNISVSTSRNGFSSPIKEPGDKVSVSNEEATEKIKKEFHSNIVKFTELLKEFLKNADEEIKKDFENKYLSLTQSSMLNLNSLIYDLSWVKKYNNSLRK